MLGSILRDNNNAFYCMAMKGKYKKLMVNANNRILKILLCCRKSTIHYTLTRCRFL